MNKIFTTLVALLTAMFVLAACGDGDKPDHKTQTAANGDEFNDADVDFATEMIQHHAQALKMVDLTLGRDLDPEVRKLTEEIRAAQAPEIEQMVDWLTAWDRPIPETVRDHANAHGEGDMEMDAVMPGMMSGEEMSQLEAARGAEFQRMWLEMMIEHHDGAIEMARSEQSAGHFAAAVELAESIESSQQKEINTIERLLDS
jgi:uncharacterized protein (DUF305 family)